MKFATIAATVLVASSVLGTAGVVSASEVATGTADVSVEAGKDAGLTIDKAPGKGENNGTTITPNNLHFDTVKLSDFLDSKPKDSHANLDKGAFTVTNTLGVEWNLKANVTDFYQTGDATKKSVFDGHLKFGEADITNGGDTPLFTSTTTDEANFNNESHTRWTSPQSQATISVPVTTKIGSYTADITYTLSTGTNSQTPSGSQGN